MSNSPSGKAPTLQRWKIIVPLLLGVAVSTYLFISTFHPSTLSSIHFSYRLLTGLLAGVFFVVLRDFAFIYKIRLSTGSSIGWKSAFVIIILWEFGSAISPGAVGGIAFALFLLAQEGITYGRSTAIVLMNTFLDSLAFVVVFGGLYLFLGHQMFNVSADCPDLVGHPILQEVRQLGSKVWVGYLIYIALVALLGTALFILPHTTKRFFHFLSRRSYLKFAADWLVQYGNDIELASNEFKSMGGRFWGAMTGATFVNWMARFALPNALFYGFANHPLNVIEIYARQFVAWIFLVIPSTPGASGLAEVVFMSMNCEFIPTGLSAAVTTIWRLYSYYIYLGLGIIILPRWLKYIQQRKAK